MRRYAPALLFGGLLLVTQTVLYLQDLAKADWLIYVSDSDSQLRLFLVETLYRIGGWQHHIIDRLTPPAGTSTPWTRPLDVILLALASPFIPFVGIHKALLIGSSFYANLCLLTLVVAMLRLHLHFGGRAIGGFGIVSLLLFYPVMISYYSATNADHHALMGLLFGLLLTALCTTGALSRKSAIGIGAGLGLGLWISTEFLAPAFLIYLWWAVRWMSGDEKAGKIAFLSTVVAAVLLLALAVERPFEEWPLVVYDTVALPLVTLMASVALAWWGLAAFERSAQSWKRRAVALAVAGGVLAVAMLAAFPKILEGPLAAADLFMLRKFLDYMTEMMPFWNVPYQAVPLVLFAALALARLPWRQLYRERRWDMALLVATMLFFLVCTLLHRRFAYYLMPAMSVLVALAIERSVPSLVVSAYLLILLPVPSGLGVVLAQRQQEAAPVDPLGSDPECYDTVIRSLIGPAANLPASLRATDTLYVPADVTPLLLFETPYRYLAGNYHRGVEGFLAYYRYAYAGSDAEAATAIAGRDVRLVAFCRSWARPGTYFERLLAHPPAGYRPLALGDGKEVAAFLLPENVNPLDKNSQKAVSPAGQSE